MKVLLDTNICIHLINQKSSQVLQRFQSYLVGEVGVSSVTASELAFGVEKSKSQRNRDALMRFMAPLEIMSYSDREIWHYARIRAQLESIGQPIGALDTMIAAHALALGVPLVTNHTSEFARVEGLVLENWV